MSIASIASSTLLHYSGQAIQSNRQKWQQSMQQLGQDLQSGNLSAAQSDFATLQQMAPQIGSTSSSQSNSSVAQDFTQLGKDLQAGNTTAAQQDYAQLQHDVSPTAAGAAHHHHHHGGGRRRQRAQPVAATVRAAVAGRQSQRSAAGLHRLAAATAILGELTRDNARPREGLR